MRQVPSSVIPGSGWTPAILSQSRNVPPPWIFPKWSIKEGRVRQTAR